MSQLVKEDYFIALPADQRRLSRSARCRPRLNKRIEKGIWVDAHQECPTRYPTILPRGGNWRNKTEACCLRKLAAVKVREDHPAGLHGLTDQSLIVRT